MVMISNDTTIDAVNRVLSSIGDSPVNTIEKPKNVNVINAIRILNQISRQEQAKGWSFNINKKYVLNADSETNMITWSSFYLNLKGSNGSLVKKGDFVYNFNTQSFFFPSSVTVEATLLLPLDELPEPMRTFIIDKASVDFQVKYLGDPNLTQMLMQVLKESNKTLNEYEIENTDANILQNADVMAIVGG